MFNNCQSAYNPNTNNSIGDYSGNTPYPPNNSQQNSQGKIPPFRAPNIKSYDISNIPPESCPGLFNLSKNNECRSNNHIQKAQLNNNESLFLTKKRNPKQHIEDIEDDSCDKQECNTPNVNERSTPQFNKISVSNKNNVSNKVDTSRDYEIPFPNKSLSNKSNDNKIDASSRNEISTKNEKYKNAFDNFIKDEELDVTDVSADTPIDKLVLIYENNAWSFNDKAHFMNYILDHIKGIRYYAVGDNKKNVYVYLEFLGPISFDDEFKNKLTYKNIIPFIFSCDDHYILNEYCGKSSSYYTNMDYFHEINNKFERDPINNATIKKNDVVNNKNEIEDVTDLDSKNSYENSKDTVNNKELEYPSEIKKLCLYIKESYRGLALNCIKHAYNDDFFIKDINDDIWTGYDKDVSTLVINNFPEKDVTLNQYFHILKWCNNKVFKYLKMDKNGQTVYVTPKYYIVLIIGSNKLDDLGMNPDALRIFRIGVKEVEVNNTQLSIDHLIAWLYKLRH